MADPFDPFPSSSRPLQVVINLGNPILAREQGDGELTGISVDLAREFGRRHGLDVVLIPVRTAAEAVTAVSSMRADFGFFAIDPKRAAEIAFTDPYLDIEGWYLVREDSLFVDNASVDRPGVRIVVGKGSAYDLFLTRHITHAVLEHVPTSPEVVDHFVQHEMEVAAGIRQQLEADMARHPGLRLLPERFMVIRQAIGVPKARGEIFAPVFNAFLQDARASGLLAEILNKRAI